MEENQPKTGKYALNFGLLLGGISVIFTFILYTMDMHYQGGISVLIVSLVLSLAAIILGLIQFRKANNGFMSFGQALKIGVGICLIGGIVSILFNQILVNVIDPETMSKAMEYARVQLQETTNMTSDQIDSQLEMQQKFSTPVMQTAFGLLFSLFFGFVLTLIPALVLKKSQPV
jgi:DNA-binding transcriptional regulator of glucitol operon